MAWGQPFALAEQFNRRSTFIAAYRIAKEQEMASPADFARKAVLETQFLYSKANKMRWGRGAIGGTLMTFKTYSVSYLELMHRMWTQGGPEGKRAVGWAVAMLLLMGGAGGLPFMEDAEDLIDGAGQLMGYNVSAKQWRKEQLAAGALSALHVSANTTPSAQADQAAEAEIVAAGLTAPRVTADHIQALMDKLTWRYEHEAGSRHAFAHAFLGDFYIATGHNAPISRENFDAHLGIKYAKEQAEPKARDKLWELEGYALHSKLAGQRG